MKEIIIALSAFFGGLSLGAVLTIIDDLRRGDRGDMYHLYLWIIYLVVSVTLTALLVTQ